MDTEAWIPMRWPCTGRPGTRDLGRIEATGTPIREARVDFAPVIRSRYRRFVSPANES